MEVVKEFSDAGHSGKIINGRLEFSRMLEEIARSTFPKILSIASLRALI